LDNCRDHVSLPFASALKSSDSSATTSTRNNSSGHIDVFTSVSHNSSAAAAEQSMSDEDAAKYKVEAAEWKTKAKQVETLNSKLYEQLGALQTEYTDLENKHEDLTHIYTITVNTVKIKRIIEI
jgi:hypothetical protein